MSGGIPAASEAGAGIPSGPFIDGKIAYSGQTDNPEIFAMNPDGSADTNLTNHPAYDSQPAWSRDGSRIAFVSDRDGGVFDIFTMNSDGSSPTNLTDGDGGGRPAWSPDGTMIVFERGFDIWVMGSDGSSPMNLTNRGETDIDASWSPDGSRIAFISNVSGDYDVHVMDVDGSDEDNLTEDEALDRYAAWSPDGSKIAHISQRQGGGQIYLINPDGSGLQNITNDTSASDGEPAWSPDGTRIAFHTSAGGNFEIFSINRDGSGRKNLTNSPENEVDPTWQPLAVPVPFVSKAKALEGKAARFKVRIPAPLSQPVTYNFETDKGKAKRKDFKSRQGTVTFAPGQTTKKINVKTKEDGAQEPKETFFLDLTYPGGPSDRGKAKIKDDD